jgi:hypothetical protein
MVKQLVLDIPSNLFLFLERQAEEQGVPLDTFCLSLLSGVKEEATLVDPAFYKNLSHSSMRNEIRKVIESGLSAEEVRRRVNHLELQVTRRYIRK